MPNRTQRPNIHPIRDIRLPEIEVITLDNQIPIYLINQGTQPVIKLEIVFDAGRPFEHQAQVGAVTAAMLREGSARFNSFQIAEKMDYYGSSLKIPFDMDTSSVVLYTLNKHFSEIFPVLEDLLLNPIFSPTAMEKYIARSIQKMEVEIAKTDVLAYRSITEQIFGTQHPYGYNSSPENYHALTRNDIIRHFEQFYHAGACKVFISGKIDASIIDIIQKGLGQIPNKGLIKARPLPTLPESPQSLHLQQDNALQTAIRLGTPLFKRAHPDYPALYFINTLFGGYFGSRLMSNIREDKGYTYNISSTLDCMRYDGCWLISSEVSNEFATATKEEIQRELNILQNEYVEAEEIEMVRSYLMGVLLSMLDGPFNVSEVVKSLVIDEADLDFFEVLTKVCHEITPDQIQALSKRYFQPEMMWEVSVGPGVLK